MGLIIRAMWAAFKHYIPGLHLWEILIHLTGWDQAESQTLILRHPHRALAPA